MSSGEFGIQNAYRDWVNRCKATLDKLTAVANTRQPLEFYGVLGSHQPLRVLFHHGQPLQDP